MKPIYPFLGLLLLVWGCANPGREEREAASAAFRSRLTAETAEWVASNPPPYRLEQVLERARTRTLKLTEDELAASLARIDRAAAFSVFLPQVEASFGREVLHGRSDMPALSPVAFQGNRLWAHQQSLMLTQPVFTPVAWTMFVESAYGVRIRDIVRDRAREVLDAQVAALFYRAVVAERLMETYRAQIASDRALTNRVDRLADEGYALKGDRERAQARLADGLLHLQEARDQRENARMKLCEIADFWPLTAPKDGNLFVGDSLLAVRSPALAGLSVEECVWRGLLARKDLYAGDQTIALRKAQVIEALAGFLPNVLLGGGGINQGVAASAIHGWGGGLTATWSAFEGFRTVQDYRAARAKREAEFKLQEDRMLAVVTGVAEAYRNWKRCGLELEAAAQARRAAETDYAETELRFGEGEETLSTVLDKLAVRDAARVQYAAMDYSSALAEVVLRQTMGLGIFEEIEK